VKVFDSSAGWCGLNAWSETSPWLLSWWRGSERPRYMMVWWREAWLWNNGTVLKR